jgi:hypothetical protein
LKTILLLILLLMLSACVPSEPQASEDEMVSKAEMPTPSPARADLPDLGIAPELENQIWLNSETPLRLGDHKGQVVLIDMWTFG